MSIQINLQTTKSTNFIDNYWTIADFKAILELCNFPDGSSIKDNEVLEYLNMALTDQEPRDAANILLTYKLSEELSEGQIDQLSNDMLLDKVVEEYPRIDLHYDLFNINQLLFRAFNGKFPNTIATIIELTITTKDEAKYTKEQLLRMLANGLKNNCLVKRLYSEQLELEEPLEVAEHILWVVENEGNDFKIITSEYWIDKEDFGSDEWIYEIQD